MPTELAVGLMSGTSVDGVDAALVQRTRGGDDVRYTFVAGVTVPYDLDMRRRVLTCCTGGPVSVGDVGRLGVRLAEAFARAVHALLDRACVRAHEVTVIGSHGQTVWHEPGGSPPFTLQLGQGAVLAERTRIPVVEDFRPADVAAGGQGAPLVPYADYLLLGHPSHTRVSHNIGGIANLTYLPAGGAIDRVIAFDTGPGNMVLDALIDHATGGRDRFDRDGRIARRGRVHAELLDRWLAHPYFAQAPPKSTGRELFGQGFVRGVLDENAGVPIEDLLATAVELTARSMTDSYRQWLPATPALDEVVLCGGGASNAYLVERVRALVPGVHVGRSDDHGVPADFKEAMAFAVLAWATLDGQPGNVAGATGADGPRVLGKICPATGRRLVVTSETDGVGESTR